MTNNRAPLDPEELADGLRLLQLAHDRWRAAMQEISGTTLTPAEWDKTKLHAYGAAIETLTWVRALDDACKHPGEPAPNYPIERPQREGLLDGARYVCNHAIHQLGVLSRPVGGISGPWSDPLVSNKLAGFSWVDERSLPPRYEERDDRQRQLRDQYLQHLAHREIDHTLSDLRQWHERHLS